MIRFNQCGIIQLIFEGSHPPWHLAGSDSTKIMLNFISVQDLPFPKILSNLRPDPEAMTESGQGTE